ncbi:hypothetical protein PYCC9005_004688 [Savitreella phatthalungensis]
MVRTSIAQLARHVLPLGRPLSAPLRLGLQLPCRLSGNRPLSSGASSAVLAEDVDHEPAESGSPSFEETSNAAASARWTDFAGKLHPKLLRAVQTGFGYETMTNVQKEVVSSIDSNFDLLVRSRTGTGKTLGFLVPAVQRSVEALESAGISTDKQARPAFQARRGAQPSREERLLMRQRKDRPAVLIISPTRELAKQIAVEAGKLTGRSLDLGALVCVGGESKQQVMYGLKSGKAACDIIVGTPGRLFDMLQTEEVFRDLVSRIHTVVLDEADTLLEMGFKDELDGILAHTPEDRRTYMFSATLSPEIREVARNHLKEGFHYIDTVPKGQVDVHMRIPQKWAAVPMKDQLQALTTLLADFQRDPASHEASKVIVFLPTTKTTKLYAEYFAKRTLVDLLPMRRTSFFEIHSARTQANRESTARRFRQATGPAVLLTTDVSARGVDYPNVGLVVQIGAASSRDIYVHRIGRTGRAGKSGQAFLMVDPSEAVFASQVLAGSGLPIVEQDILSSASAAETASAAATALKNVDRETLRGAFSSLTGSMLPRARELDTTRRNIVGVLEDWFRAHNRGGACEEEDNRVPPISRMLLAGDSPPPRTSGRRYDRGENAFRDRRPFAGGRDFGDRQRSNFNRRGSFSDRSEGEYTRSPRSSGDRPPRSFGDRPPRSFGDRPPRSFDDQPPRSFGDRPVFRRERRADGGSDFTSRPRRSFSADRDEDFS